jgi:predicted nuclease of restriction endonuclease-like RecB superfamily
MLVRQGRSGYISNHQKRGKTYKEIYGTSTPKNGFKKGKLNPNYTRPNYIGCVLPNSRGERFRSSLEVNFSEFCIKNNIPYQYEVRTHLCNGKLKIVDFVLDNLIYVEITGFAHSKWQEEFINKMFLLRQSITNPILVLTYDHHLRPNDDLEIGAIYKVISDKDMFVESVSKPERVLEKIKMFKVMNFINNHILNKNATNIKKVQLRRFAQSLK